MIEKILFLMLTLLSEKALALDSKMSTGHFGIEAVSGSLTMDQIIMNVINVGTNTIGAICTAIFIAGAFFIASSTGNDQRKSLGKDLMIGAVMGIAIIAAAKGIINIAYSFLYAS